MSKKADKPRYNVFIGESKICPNATITTDPKDKSIVHLAGPKDWQRWTYRKDQITRKVKVSA